YHQVKRMVAAAGNRVEKLHRERVGGYALPGTLAEGAWRWLDEADLAALRREPETTPKLRFEAAAPDASQLLFDHIEGRTHHAHPGETAVHSPDARRVRVRPRRCAG